MGAEGNSFTEVFRGVELLEPTVDGVERLMSMRAG